MITHATEYAVPARRPEVCVMGAGAAGIAIARDCARAGRQVLLLESGEDHYDARIQALYASENVGLPHGGDGYRFRQLGGSTTQWAGQALPFLDIDFERRDWVEASGWPIGRDDLEQYYLRAAEVMAIPPFDRELSWPSALPAPPAIDPAVALPLWSIFSATPNFADLYREELRVADRITVVLGANVVEIVASDKAVDAVRIRTLDGVETLIEADFFVLCTGGIETPRILLCSRREAGGLGNGNDLVGRYFQDHPGMAVGEVTEAAPGSLDLFRPAREGRYKYTTRFAASAGLQRRERVLHTSATVTFDLSQPASIRAGKTLVRALRQRSSGAQARRAVGAILRDPQPLARAAWRYARGGGALDTSVRPIMTVGGEQAPNPESRISLSGSHDELGTPRAQIDWRLTVDDLRSYRVFATRIADEFERAGLGSVDLSGFSLPDDPTHLAGRIVDAGHHMGATRMGEDPTRGVVDPECRVHGIENLYVGSCSVFPTGGVANPTFTMLALSHRIADRLIERSA